MHLLYVISVLMLMQCRTLAAAAFVLSIAVYTGFVSFYSVMFHLPYFYKFPPQLWRLFSSFLITGPDLGIIFDTYFCKLQRICGTRLELTKFSVHVWKQA